MWEDLGKRLRTAREDRRMVLRDAGKNSGIPFSTIGAWEQGKACPPADALWRLAELYGVSAAWLLGYEESMAGVRLIDQWPRGLREFIGSEWAEMLKLRPWEVGVLAALGPDGSVSEAGWAQSLMKWRLAHGDLIGLQVATGDVDDDAGAPGAEARQRTAKG